MARTPTIPPRNQWFRLVKDARGDVIGVEPTDAFYKFSIGEREYSTNVNTGVNRARAEAAAAQTTAESASQTAQDVASNEFTLTVDSPFAFELIAAEAPVYTTTSSVTVTPSGGTAPYSYLWAKVSGDDFDIGAPTSATTAFSGAPEFNSDLSGVYRCTVTDDAGSPLTASITVSVTISHISITG